MINNFTAHDVWIDPQWGKDRNAGKIGRHPIKPYLAHKEKFIRIGGFCDWLKSTDYPWYDPHLKEYQDSLLERGLSRSTVATYISTIRGRATDILSNPTLGGLLSPTQKLEFMDSLEIDRPDNNSSISRERLTPDELKLVVSQYSRKKTFAAIRDTAIVSLFGYTGIRAQELCDLEVDDLKQLHNNELCVFVRLGKGGKSRWIPYLENRECTVPYIDKWLQSSGITSGPVFRGLRRGGNVRPTPSPPDR